MAGLTEDADYRMVNGVSGGVPGRFCSGIDSSSPLQYLPVAAPQGGSTPTTQEEGRVLLRGKQEWLAWPDGNNYPASSVSSLPALPSPDQRDRR